MTTLVFLLGFLCGAAALMAIALHFSRKAKPKQSETPTFTPPISAGRKHQHGCISGKTNTGRYKTL